MVGWVAGFKAQQFRPGIEAPASGALCSGIEGTFPLEVFGCYQTKVPGKPSFTVRS